MNILYIAFMLLFATSVQAAELVWDPQTIASPLTVERSATNTGTDTWATEATLPAGATRYILTPGAYGWYRVRYSGLANSLPSNSVQFSLDLYTGTVTSRLDALDTAVSGIQATLSTQPTSAQFAALTARVTALEAVPTPTPTPTPTGNLTVRQIDADHIEVVGGNCLSLRTTGTGLRRTLECVH